eukprot:m.61820 g.61820  ORF g.61820 m.61820 type:complete len:160 (-) comp13903_c0_seq8:653-1132(-)
MSLRRRGVKSDVTQSNQVLDIDALFARPGSFTADPSCLNILGLDQDDVPMLVDLLMGCTDEGEQAHLLQLLSHLNVMTAVVVLIGFKLIARRLAGVSTADSCDSDHRRGPGGCPCSFANAHVQEPHTVYQGAVHHCQDNTRPCRMGAWLSCNCIFRSYR